MKNSPSSCVPASLTSASSLLLQLWLLTVSLVLLPAGSALRAQTPIHAYEFNGTMADTYGGPAMSGGTFPGQTTYTFGIGQGPGVQGAIPANADYSLEMLFYFSSMPGTYASLVNFSNLTSDGGLYLWNRAPYFAPNGGSPTSPVVPLVTYSRMVITRSFSTQVTKIYLDGNLAATRTDTANTYLSPSGWLHFFRDDGSENAPGVVDAIRMYDTVLSDSQIAAMGVGATALPEISLFRGTTSGTELFSSSSTSDLGSITLGNSSAAQTFTIWNTGKKDLILGTLSKVTNNASYPNYADFTLGTPAKSVLAPGESTTFTVTFTPSATGARLAQVNIPNNDQDESTFVTNLSGTGTAPVPLSPSRFWTFNGTFNDSLGGTPMGPYNANGTNNQSPNLSATYYSWDPGQNLDTSSVLSNYNEWTMELVFKLAKVTGYNALVNFDSLAGDNAVFVQDGKLSFYGISSGAVSASGLFSADTWYRLIVTRRASDGQMKGYVDGTEVLSATAGSGQLAGQAPQGRLKFFGDASGEVSGGSVDLIRIYYGVMPSTQATALGSGRVPDIRVTLGTSSGPEIVNGSLLDYGYVQVGAGNQKLITIANLGTGNLTVQYPGLSGANSFQFAIAGNPAGTIPPLSTASFNLNFFPTSVGTKNAYMQLGNSDANDNPYAINLTGVAVWLPTVTAVSPASGLVAGGTPVTITGTDFMPGVTSVTIGGVAATAVSVQTSTLLTCTTPAGTSGAKSVVVTTPGGVSNTGINFTYNGVPTVVSASPSAGALAGGNTVTLTGTDFLAGATVTIGGNAASNVNVVNATTLTCTAPAGTAGAKSVIVTTAGGSSAANSLYTYAGAPTLTNVSPGSGPLGGGNTVTLTGTGFLPGTAVAIGGGQASAVTVTSLTSLTCTAPAGAAGVANVSVTTAAGSSAGGITYTYVAAPTVTNVTPNSGPVAGGTSLTLAGTAFIPGATTVTIGGSAATAVNVASATSLTCIAPAGTAGAKSVIVTTAGGSNPANTLFTYYVPAPEIAVTGLGVDITDGDATPAATDGTSFASTGVVGPATRNTFTITNSATATSSLTLGTATVTGDFMITQPLATTLAPGASTTFTVDFDPTTTGTRTGTVSIPNNDSNENPFDFSVSGVGTAPEISVTGAGVDLADGDTTPAVTDGTDFGSVMANSASKVTRFTITNSAAATTSLTLGPVTVTGAGFTTTQPVPAGAVPIGGSVTFDVSFTPTTTGPRTATVSFSTNDIDENPFNYSIQGTGMVLPTITTPTSASITTVGAVLGGNVTSDGGSPLLSRGVLYSATATNADPTTGGTGVTTVTLGSTTGVFTIPVSGLTPGTAYSFKAYVDTAAGVVYTSVATFTTGTTPPALTIQASTNVQASSATVNGTVTSEGTAAVTERGFVYAPTSVTTTPAIGGPGVVKLIKVGSLGSFTAALTGLSVSTAYNVRAYATSSAGTSYSPVGGLTTVTPIPLTVVANNATRTFGAANPAFTGTVTGLVAGDGITVTYGTPAGATSSPGTYAIAPVLADPLGRLGKYALARTDGVLTITAAQTTTVAAAATVQVSASAQPVALSAAVTSGGAAVAAGSVSFQVKNGAANVGSAVVASVDAAGLASASYTLPAGLAGGSYSIIATFAATTNYRASTSAAAVLTVVPPPPVSSFVVEGVVSPVTAGVPSTTLTVEARNAAGGVYTGYRGTIRFTSTDASAVLPAAYTFTAADAGLHTFSVTLRTAGEQGITATDAAAVVSGSQTGIFVDPTTGDKRLLGWGANASGQLGDGTTNDALTPAALPPFVPGPAGAFGTGPSVAAGATHSVGLLANGRVYAWGSNTKGELGNMTTTASPLAVPVRWFTGDILSSAVAVAAGEKFSLALLPDNSVWAWGDVPGLGLTAPWTYARPVPGLSSVAAISAGGRFAMVLKHDGTVWTWGENASGVIGNGTLAATVAPVQVAGLTGISSISAGAAFAVAVERTTGSVWTWGANDRGQLGRTTTAAYATTPGQVVGAAGAGTLSGIASTAAGGSHVLALRSDGSLLAWGGGATGALGLGTFADAPVPAPVLTPAGTAPLGSIRYISAGAWHSLARTTDGVVLAWGQGGQGQLGLGTPTDRFLPTAVPGFTPAGFVTSGPLATHSLALDGPSSPVRYAFTLPPVINALTSFTVGVRAVDALGNSLVYTGRALFSLDVPNGYASPYRVNFPESLNFISGVPYGLTIYPPSGGVHTLTAYDKATGASSSISFTAAPKPSKILLSAVSGTNFVKAYVIGADNQGLESNGWVTFRFIKNGTTLLITAPEYTNNRAGAFAYTEVTKSTAAAWGAGVSVEASFSGTALFSPSTATIAATFTSFSAPAAPGRLGARSSSSSTEQVGTFSPSTTTLPSVGFSLVDRFVTLSTDGLLPAGAADQGTVIFSIATAAGERVGQACAGDVAGGIASASALLPAGLPVGDYVVTTFYTGGPTAPASEGELSLSVLPAASTVVADPVLLGASAAAQSVLLTAQATSPAGPLTSGSITFQVKGAGGANAGTAVTVPVAPPSGGATAGAVRAAYTLPAGLAGGSYTIAASYTSATAGIASSSDEAHLLTIERIPLAVRLAVADQAVLPSAGAQAITLTAQLASSEGATVPVAGGTVAFRLFATSPAGGPGALIGTAATSSIVVAGTTTASYTVPFGTPAGAYIIEAAYTGSTPVTGALFTTAATTARLTYASAHQAWRLAYFGTPEPTGLAAPGADSDNDGIPNLLEYAFGQHPAGGPSPALPAAQIAGGAFFVSFTQPAGVSGITYGAEWSPSLAPGSWMPIPDTGSGSVHTFSVSAADQRKFLRLTISEP